MLYNNSSTNQLFLNNSKWFKNVSTVDIPGEVSDFLSLGPKFSVNADKKNIRVEQLLADVENIIDEIPDNIKDLTRA